MRKNLDLTDEVILAIEIEAKRQVPKSDFKNHAQKILSDYAKPLIALEKQKSEGKKQIKND